MAWTPHTSGTFSDDDVLTAAHMDQIVGNINETSAATAQARGDIITADAANSMGHRIPLGTEGKILVAGANDPEWADLSPRRNGSRSATGNVSSVGTQKVSTTLTIPSTWSSGWSLMAWGVTRFIWNGTATSGDVELLVGGSGMSPSTEQDVPSTGVVGPVSVIGVEDGLTDTGLVQVGLLLVANGTADYADAWVTAVGYYET